MKKSIFYLLMLLINLFFSLFARCAYAEQTYYSVLDGSNSISLSANPEERTTPTLELRNGIAFVLNENEPFTGKRETYYSNGQKNIEVHYKDGKKMD
jgi:antitoxin component YwqK of YwqJK toxin-antitoxin module